MALCLSPHGHGRSTWMPSKRWRQTKRVAPGSQTRCDLATGGMARGAETARLSGRLKWCVARLLLVCHLSVKETSQQRCEGERTEVLDRRSEQRGWEEGFDESRVGGRTSSMPRKPLRSRPLVASQGVPLAGPPTRDVEIKRRQWDHLRRDGRIYRTRSSFGELRLS
jgi:hypothetical protein